MHALIQCEKDEQTARQRAQVYRRLAALFLGADFSRTVAAIRRAPLRNRLGRLMGNSASEHLFKSYLTGSRPSTLMEQIAEEHRELFGGPSKRSALLSEHAFLRRAQMDAARAATLADLYTRFGFEYQRHGRQADHLGVELLFVAHLCALERRAWHQAWHEVAKQNVGHQRQFLQEHLIPWTHWLRDAIEQSDRACWFRVIATATEAFVATDYERLQALYPPPMSSGCCS